MSRQSKNAKKLALARNMSQIHKNGGKGPTPKGGPFPPNFAAIPLPKALRQKKQKQ